jgi:hypothetical protein
VSEVYRKCQAVVWTVGDVLNEVYAVHDNFAHELFLWQWLLAVQIVGEHLGYIF